MLIDSLMILFVFVRHGEYDEEDYIAQLRSCQHIMLEGKKLGGKGLLIFSGGDLDIEVKLEGGGEKLQGPNSLDWYGLHRPECQGGCEDVETYDKKNFDGHAY